MDEIIEKWDKRLKHIDKETAWWEDFFPNSKLKPDYHVAREMVDEFLSDLRKIQIEQDKEWLNAL